MTETLTQNLGFAHYWAQGDFVTHGVAYVLLIMSIASWYYILSKAWTSLRIRKSAAALEHFWDAPSMDDAIALLNHADTEHVYAPLATHAQEAVNFKANSNTLNATVDVAELVTRTLRQQINRISSRLEGGLTLLASVGSTAPFIGLFGTVWGIYHALAAVSSSGTLQIDKVAGPVGEALIMTAIGLMVAIPAVLGYNAFTRVNRLTLAELDAFAHDLHAHLTTGSRVSVSLKKT
jgi:biopolymer transport protein ExbB